MVDINLLDKTLTFIKEKRIYGLIAENTPEFTEEENEYLHEAIKRLEKDGYIYSEHKGQYLISFNGMLALQETYFLRYRTKPYKRAEFKKAVQSFWLFLKMMFVFLNAVLVLALAILTFIFKD